ncbi:unnamed protein product [Ectocarpus sp. 12 AP-2014]
MSFASSVPGCCRLGTHQGVVEVMAILNKDSSMAIVLELGQTVLQHAMCH